MYMGWNMKHKLTVLIVEDNPDDYFLLKEVLESAEIVDAVIFHESKLGSGLSTAASKPIDVAIIDLSLPDSFGLDTFVTFHERFPFLPTIIMTGAKDQEMAFEAVRQGAQDYLFKSELLSSAIVRSIRYAIERQHLTTELKSALEYVKHLEELLPICCICKNIRNDHGYWDSIEAYVAEHLPVKFSHGICPECAKKHYPELFKSRV